jgi:hypothetical protein
MIIAFLHMQRMRIFISTHRYTGFSTAAIVTTVNYLLLHQAVHSSSMPLVATTTVLCC